MQREFGIARREVTQLGQKFGIALAEDRFVIPFAADFRHELIGRDIIEAADRLFPDGLSQSSGRTRCQSSARP